MNEIEEKQNNRIKIQMKLNELKENQISMEDKCCWSDELSSAYIPHDDIICLFHAMNSNKKRFAMKIKIDSNPQNHNNDPKNHAEFYRF